MKVVRCDICKEDLNESDNYKVVNFEWNRPEPRFENLVGYGKAGVFDTDHRTLDICPTCWNKIYSFAKVYSEDPHVKLVREDGSPV